LTDIRAVKDRKDLRRFVNYPYDRYAADPHWIPPLRMSEHERLTPKKNPFFAHADVELLLAWRGDSVVGRIAAIDDRLHLETHGDNVAMFGFYEAADKDATHALLGAVESWARARGRAHVRGPVSPSLNESAGLLIDGFDTDPMVMMPHNPPEYAEFVESAGYGKIKDLYAWLYAIDAAPPAIISRLAERVQTRERLVVRPLNPAEFMREVERMCAIYCGAWEHNWGFVAPTADEFRRIASEIKPIFDPRCSVSVEVDGRMVAMAVAVPDINQALKGTNGRLLPLGLLRLLLRKRYITQLRLLLLGVDPAYRTRGLYPLLLAELHRQVAGVYERAEFSWVLEDNRDINQPAEMAGARRYKTYRIYQKALS
jgi:GNAT superfamily N-acetyltransferase